MENVLKNLREKSILHREQVMDIKRYIEKKYPDATPARRANIFANTVHQIVDESVSRFEEKHRIQIRSEVLKSAIAKDIFEISGYDVFEVCSTFELEDEAEEDLFFERLTDWVNENQQDQVSVVETKAMAKAILDQAISSMVDLLEDSLLIDDQIVEINRNRKEIDGPEYIEDLPNVLEDHITDGRFMNVEGDIVELTAEAIEKALREAIPEEDEYGFSDKISDGSIPKPDVNSPEAQAQALAKQLKASEPEENYNRDQDQGDSENDDDVFDSMDALFLTQDESGSRRLDNPIEVKTQDKKTLEDGPLEGVSVVNKLSGNGDVNWEEVKVEHKDLTATRLGGYELNPPPVIEDQTDKLPKNIRLLLIVPVVLILVMVIIVLIVGAIQITQRAAANELERQEAILAREASISLYIEDMNIPAGLPVAEDASVFPFEPEGDLLGSSDDDLTSHLHKDLQYREIDNQQLVSYLENKNSSLARIEIVETLVQVASTYNVNPLLLIAITGQEQGFVPKNHADADLMVNNPFNVYESWLDYNTDFENACKIAAGTVVKLSEGRPEEVDPIAWINRKYAEDDKWHEGVTYFFHEVSDWMDQE